MNREHVRLMKLWNGNHVSKQFAIKHGSGLSGRGPSTDLADLRAQISSISNPPVSIDDTADCNLELRVGMSVT